MTTPVLALPGLLNDERLWQHQAQALSARHPFTIVPSTSGDSVQALAAAALAQAPATQFILAGFSLGGYVALEVMRQAPGRVLGLALVDTSARPDTAASTQGRKAAIAAAQSPSGADDVFASLFARLVLPAHAADKALIALLRQMADAVGVAGFVRQQTAAMNRPDSRPTLAAIRCPALVMCGRADQITPLEVSTEIAAGIEGARLVVIEDSGHMAPLEQPRAVTAALQDWLASVGAG